MRALPALAALTCLARAGEALSAREQSAQQRRDAHWEPTGPDAPGSIAVQNGLPMQPMSAPPIVLSMPGQPMMPQPMYIVQQPMVQQPAAQQPMAQQPMAQQPMAQQPMAQQPMALPPVYAVQLPPLQQQQPAVQAPTEAPHEVHKMSVEEERAQSLEEEMKLEQSLDISARALQLALGASDRVRRLSSALYRQVKLVRQTKFDYALTAEGPPADGGPQEMALCGALIARARDLTEGDREKEMLHRYLAAIDESPEKAAQEVRSCHIETTGNAQFNRLFFKLGNPRVENIVMRALEADGNKEVVGAGGRTPDEELARNLLKEYRRLTA